MIRTASPTLFWKCAKCGRLVHVAPVQTEAGRMLLCIACTADFLRLRQIEPPSREPYRRPPPPVTARDPSGAGRCASCGVPVEGREDKRYCSDACRQKAYRSRLELEARHTPQTTEQMRAVARRLRAAGRSDYEIAAELPITVAQVRRFTAPDAEAEQSE
jgi:hypothetical protein